MKTLALVQVMTRDGWGRAHVLEAPTTPSLVVGCGENVAGERRRFPSPAELEAGDVHLCGRCARTLPARYRLQGSDTVRGEGA